MDEPLASLPPSTPYQKTLSLFWARPHHHRHIFHHIYLVVVALLPRLRSQDRTSGVNFSSGCKVNIVGFPAVPCCASLPQVYPREAVAMREKIQQSPYMCNTSNNNCCQTNMLFNFGERKRRCTLRLCYNYQMSREKMKVKPPLKIQLTYICFGQSDIGFGGGRSGDGCGVELCPVQRPLH